MGSQVQTSAAVARASARPGGFRQGGSGLASALGWSVFEHDPEVAAAYTLHRLVGKGSYGHVVEAVHVPTKQRVAIKRIQYVFDDERDARCILREIRCGRGARGALTGRRHFFPPPPPPRARPPPPFSA